MDKRYVAFGRVIDGLDVLRQLHGVDVKPNQMPVKPMCVVSVCALSLILFFQLSNRSLNAERQRLERVEPK